jgi:glycosyltransferase involved in cell wall biosynthesis
MHIVYFSNHFAACNAHGVARYAANLYEALRAEDPGVGLTPIATWSNRSNEDLQALTRRTGLQILPWGRRITPLAWTFLNRPRIEHWVARPVDVVHLVAMGFPVATRKPLVVTVHDLGPLTHPEYFSVAPPWIYRRSLRQVIRQAAAVICVSQATAGELTDYVSRTIGHDISDRIHVIHEGVESRFFAKPDPGCLSTVRGLLPPQVPFILTAGKISPRKNVQGVVKALAILAEDIPHHLVVVGGEGWDTESVHHMIGGSEIAERVHLIGYVTDEQLHALYHAASAYVHPSLFEGFGLPVLEAMAAGCPVVTSNVSSLPEVAGDNAILVNPKDVCAIAEAIRAVCSDAALVTRLKDAGLARAKSFSWARTARETMRVYQDVR